MLFHELGFFVFLSFIFVDFCSYQIINIFFPDSIKVRPRNRNSHVLIDKWLSGVNHDGNLPLLYFIFCLSKMMVIIHPQGGSSTCCIIPTMSYYIFLAIWFTTNTMSHKCWWDYLMFMIFPSIIIDDHDDAARSDDADHPMMRRIRWCDDGESPQVWLRFECRKL